MTCDDDISRIGLAASADTVFHSFCARLPWKPVDNLAQPFCRQALGTACRHFAQRVPVRYGV